MQHDVVRTKWKHFRNEINSQWADLNSDDLDQIDGRRDNLIILLEHKYGYARGRAEREVERVVTDFELRLRRAS